MDETIDSIQREVKDETGDMDLIKACITKQGEQINLLSNQMVHILNTNKENQEQLREIKRLLGGEKDGPGPEVFTKKSKWDMVKKKVLIDKEGR